VWSTWETIGTMQEIAPAFACELGAARDAAGLIATLPPDQAAHRRLPRPRADRERGHPHRATSDPLNADLLGKSGPGVGKDDNPPVTTSPDAAAR